MIHTRSRVLKGTRTKLTLAARFLALSGYMKWWVVRLPASSSKPTVGARLILGTEHTHAAKGTLQARVGKTRRENQEMEQTVSRLTAWLTRVLTTPRKPGTRSRFWVSERRFLLF